MADEYYQKAGEYPYLPDIPTELSDVLPPVPYSFYEQTDGEYPVVADMPDIVKAVSPVPYSFYEQDGITNNGYPFINEMPSLINGMKKPLPYLLYKPNKAKKVEFKITVCSSDNTITIPDMNTIIKAVYPSTHEEED